MEGCDMDCCEQSNEVHEMGKGFHNTHNKLLMKGFCSMEAGTCLFSSIQKQK